MVVAALTPGIAEAATVTVTTTLDQNNGVAPCSLREAIRSVNLGTSVGGCVNSGPAYGTNDTILFAIPDVQADPVTRVRTLTINAAGLPAVAKPVIIDGYSQTDLVVTQARPNTNTPDQGGSNALILIEVRAPDTSGPVLQVSGGNSVVRGLAINGSGANVAGADGPGIRLDTAGGNRIEGNFIGTDAGGTIGKANKGNGVLIMASSSGNTIGGLTPDTRNIVSGNQDAGHRVQSSNNSVYGNLIGTDKNGTAALGNGQGGINILDAPDNQIGNGSVAARNIIAANGSRGIRIQGCGCTTGNKVQGNYIGLDVTGNNALANQDAGIRIENGANTNTIGGGVGLGNVISGNIMASITLFGAGADNEISFNTIGTNAAGTVARGNGLNGIRINNTTDTKVLRNLVSGNGENGIWINGSASARNILDGNRIGTDVNGTSNLGNVLAGVLIEDAFDNRVGDTVGNIIAFNGGDSDIGPNNLQNFPTLSGVATSGNSTSVIISLSSTPSTAFTFELFDNLGCDPSGFGEGRTLVVRVPGQTDPSGNAAVVANTPAAVTPGHALTATATDPTGNTSEFSACVPVAADIQPGDASIAEPISGTSLLTFSVMLAQAGTAPVTVQYATADSPAANRATGGVSCVPGTDYITTAGTLTFQPGETSKPVSVPVCADSFDEVAEVLVLNLTSPTNGILARPTLSGTIFDTDVTPCLTSLQSPAPAGTTALPTISSVGCNVGDTIAINPGGANEEQRTIVGFGSIIVNAPTGVAHAAGEVVARISAPGAAAVAVPIAATPRQLAPEDDTDKHHKETEEERQQRQRTNRSGKDDVHTEGNVVEARCEGDVPTIMIVNRDGIVAVRLLGEAAGACGSAHVGDYLEADGEKVTEQRFDADSIEITRIR
jgi:CSLREA domain-containing protein